MDIDWREPWYADTNPKLADELRREMAPGHVLENERELVTIARRQDCDDVLFGLADGRVAVVHLTYATKRETAVAWPWTKIYPDLEHFVTVVMPDDATEFGG